MLRQKKSSKKKYKKAGINNKLRGLLNEKLATLTIFSKNKNTRLTAARNILKNLSPSSVEILRNAVQKEEDSEVKRVNERLYRCFRCKI